MAVERKLKVVGPVAFTVDGGSNGLVTVKSTYRFKVKASVVLSATGLPDLTLEVKRVLDKTTLLVGPGTNILKREDISAYTVALGATIFQPEQDRPGIPFEQHMRAAFEEEPTLAHRTILVDPDGDFYDTDNPLKVQLTDGSINIETLNAELRVQLSAKDDDPTAGDVHSSVRIGDQNNELMINDDKSINVHVISGGGSTTVINFFNDITSVATGVPTTLLTYTAPLTGITSLFKIEYSGDNIAQYDVLINGVLNARKRTYWGGPINGLFEFNASAAGFKLNAGDVVTVVVTHTRPFVGNFEARLQATLT